MSGIPFIATKDVTFLTKTDDTVCQSHNHRRHWLIIFARVILVTRGIQHIEADTTWPSFRRQHFQTHFHE